MLPRPIALKKLLLLIFAIFYGIFYVSLLLCGRA